MDGASGKWFVEAGFGPGSITPPAPMFDSLDEARAWASPRVARDRLHTAPPTGF